MNCPNKMLFLFLIGFPTFFGCAYQSGKPDFAFPNHSVLLISIDTCRTDYVEPFGRKSSTPYINQLAEDGVWFSNAITTVPLTVPAHASLFTGLYPVEVGVRDNYKAVLPSGAITLAEHFHEAGYTTAGFIGAILLSENWGFHQGFEVYEDEFTTEEYEAQEHTVERTADKVSELAIQWINKYGQQDEQNPFFLFLHYYDPHLSYIPPEPYRTEYADDLYAGEIAFTDECIGRVLDALHGQNLYDDTIIALVGDHGEGLGEHGETSHGLFLYDETIQIPVLIKLPSQADRKNIESRQYINICDLPPTLLDITKTVAPDDIVTSGISLTPWLSGEASLEDREFMLETQYPTVYNWAPLFALRTEHWKFIQAPKPELYDLRHDPDELKNEMESNAALAGEMKTRLEDMLLTASSTLKVQPGEMISSSRSEQLASLGYVGGSSLSSSDTPADELPDPKDKIGIHRRFEKGLAYLAENKLEPAETLFLDLAKQDPKNPSIHHHLAHIYVERKEWEKAYQSESRALEISPENYTYQLQLAWILLQQKQYDESRKWLLQVLGKQSNIAEAQFLLGVIALEQNQPRQAMSYFIRTERLAPNYPGLEQIKEQMKSMMQALQRH